MTGDFICVVLCLVAIVGVSASNYCSDDICGGYGPHISCNHNGRFDRSCPPDAKMVNLTPQLKQLLVDAHNAKRNFTAGGNDGIHGFACRMATMQWDEELAKLAALNVMQCKMSHDRCHNTNNFQYSGQNLAWFGFTGGYTDANKLSQAVESWHNEFKDSNMEYIKKYHRSPQVIGHFTVMVADRNVRLGCAAATYKKEDYLEYLVACNYATTNMLDFPIYDSNCNAPGEHCTKRSEKYSNLCSPEEKYDVNKWF